MDRNEAIEVLRKYNPKDAELREVLETAVPELKKSEDERIRKAVKHLVNSTKELHFGIDNYDGVKWIDILSWLEKQGKHNAADKLNPKFRIGDKVQYEQNFPICTIESVDNTTYYCDYTNFDIIDQDSWKLVERRSFLSEDEEYTLARIIERLEDDGCPSEWLTLLNDIYSMPYQKTSERSEDDNAKIEFLCNLIQRNISEGTYSFGDGAKNGFVSKQEAIKMLQSLKPQSQWKPTKQQMEAIKQAAEQNRASEMGNILDNLFVELSEH